MRILKVELAQMGAAWPHALPWLEKAYDKGNTGSFFPDLYKDVMLGNVELYRLVSGKNFAWLAIGKDDNVCTVYALGGNGALAFLADIVAYCEEWGKKRDCKKIICYGRKGWTRCLIPYGWKEIYRANGKEL